MKKVEVFLKKKFIPSLFLMICIFNANAQKKWDTTERIYKNGVYLQGTYDIESNKFVKIAPVGKNVNVTYDPYYNNYKITWNESDKKKQMNLSPSRETPSNGTIFMDTYVPEGKEKGEYFIIDEIIKSGRLQVIYINEITIEGKKYKLVFFFEDLN